MSTSAHAVGASLDHLGTTASREEPAKASDRHGAGILLFLSGMGAFQLLVIGIALAASATAGGVPPGSARLLAFTLLACPIGAAWLGASAVNRVSPRRLFDPRVHRPSARLLLGFLTGLAGTIPMTFLVSVFGDYVPDAASAALCGSCCAMIAVILLPRRRQGQCVHCGYDLRSLPGAAVCPECGAAGSG